MNNMCAEKTNTGYLKPAYSNLFRGLPCLCLVILSLLSPGCRKDHFDVDTSDIELKLDVQRFEKDLFAADPSALMEYLPAWSSGYGVFLRDYLSVLGISQSDSVDLINGLQEFVTDALNYRIYKRTMEVFPDVDTEMSELTEAFKRYRYHFEDRVVPRIVTFVGGLAQAGITDDSLLAVGLDRYLGRDEELYRQLGVYEYQSVNMHRDKLVSDCMLFWGETEFAFNDSVNTLAANMIYKGRLMYFVRAMLPGQPDTLIWGFSGEQWDFCLKNEKAMWTHLVGNKLLFSTDRLTISKFTSEGPFTSDFSRRSPARAAVWIGYRIVDGYMKRQGNISLKALMEEDDYMKILNGSAYNP